MNILHMLKHDFLIIGFTGPLRSGCTTCAEFFSKAIDQEIEKKIGEYPHAQERIEEKYRELYELKRGKNSSLIKKLNHDLRLLLREREVIKVLRDHTDNNFVYISMTDMLIKMLIENLDKKIKFPNTSLKLKEKTKIIDNLRSRISGEYSDITNLKRLSRLISNRNFSQFSEQDFNDFEVYLKRIGKTRSHISSWISDSELVGELLQDWGDNLRRRGNPFDYLPTNGSSLNTIFALAEEANNVIKFYRSRDRKTMAKNPRIKQFVIEAFRNPYEVEYFRNRYYEFYLISLFANYEIRKDRKKFSFSRDQRDRGEDLATEEYYKQNVSECVRLSDIAFNNEDSQSDLYEKLLTYFALIKQPGCFAPEWTETAMHMAYSMSVRSSCICRQVGSVIEGSNGYIVGAGWNDVGAGQIGCGYRHYEDFKNLDESVLISNPPGDEEFRRWLVMYGSSDGDSFCYKDKYSEYTIRKKLKKIEKDRPEEFKKPGRKEKKYLAQYLQKELNVKMMQYCRALHAEENAILQTSVVGGMGLRGSIIYSTTFPCELCAKKIYQAGIKKIIYTEPYPRSISKDVFFQDGTRKIDFEQFEGVKSQSYFRLYKSTIDKKEFQMLQNL